METKGPISSFANIADVCCISNLSNGYAKLFDFLYIIEDRPSNNSVRLQIYAKKRYSTFRLTLLSNIPVIAICLL